MRSSAPASPPPPPPPPPPTALLGLHADVTSGLLHDFLERDGDLSSATTTLAQPPPPRPDREAPVADDINVAFSASLASDVLLQDLPLNLERGFGK